MRNSNYHTSSKDGRQHNLSRIAKQAWLSSARLTSETLAPDTKVYQIGQVYGMYRIVVGIFLLLANYVSNEAIKSGMLPVTNLLSSKVEYAILAAYLVFAILALLVPFLWREHIRKQLLSALVIDMAFLTILFYSGTTKDLQIILLYTVTTAASFMMLSLRHAIGVTLIAIVALSFQQLYYAYKGGSSFLGLSDSVLLSMALFAVGFLSWSISQRLAIAETVAHQSAKEVKRLNAINKEVIQNIVSGIIVIGQSGRLLVVNKVAEEMLRIKAPSPSSNTLARDFEIERQITHNHKDLVEWYHDRYSEDTFHLALPQQKEQPPTNIRVYRRDLPEYGRLLILEDVGREESHAQQLKLASLGQLSASIAHEIRNPLGTISQASELLMEDANNHNSDNFDLLQMIYNQSQRVNRIIEDVMRLSRQEPPKQQPINLQVWLNAFIEQHYPIDDIALNFQSAGEIYFDPHHLEQICINLINNALRHTKIVNGAPSVLIVVQDGKNSILLDVIDNGDGVQPSDVNNLFNPFFTRSVGGTGLGLYLSKAFSEANHARLIYLPNDEKTCFRLIIPTQTYS